MIPLFEHYPELLSIEEDIEYAIEMIIECYRNNGYILLCGNGGSSSDSGHILGELMKEFKVKRQGRVDLDDRIVEGVPCIDLTANHGLITALANDVDPDIVFSQQVYVYSKNNRNNVLIGLSTSGNSANVVNAFDIAAGLGIKSIAFTGERESKLSDLATCIIMVPARDTYRAQEYHLAIYHYICHEVERILFEDEDE